MSLPFSRNDFLNLFIVYNEAIWPVQLIATAMGIFAIVLLFWRPRWADQAVSMMLVAFWSMTGIGYHWSFFSRINEAAYVFGGLFLSGALVFFIEGTVRKQIQFRPTTHGFRAWAAGGLILYSLVIYPLIGLLATHPYPETPLFGVTPCPTTIFTLGILLLARHPNPLFVAAIPLIWALIGGSAALLLKIPQDWGLLAAALLWMAGIAPRSPQTPG